MANQTMEVKLISRESVKPSSPTPPHLKIHPHSYLDNIMFTDYVPLLYFYHPNKGGEYSNDTDSKISNLKKSLSQVLSRYYHFAGRLRVQFTECNDQGVSFLVTKINNNLSLLLQNPTEELMNLLYPDELQWGKMEMNGSILAIQINCFPCGGMAIGVCISHKVADFSTLANFMNDWVNINRIEEELSLSLSVSLPFPILDAGVKVFPQENLPTFPEIVPVKEKNVVICSKRFLFQASKIKSLKALVASSQNPTRVQVVSMWIYKCAVSTLGLNFKTTSFRVAVNLRQRIIPPLPEKCVGNMACFSSNINPSVKTELQDLVCNMKEGLSEFCDVYAKKFGGKEKDLSFISQCLKQAEEFPSGVEMEKEALFTFTSWCRFSIYEADFGWGKPLWVTTAGCPVRNVIILMDTRDGEGLQAIVSMEEKDMARFERDVELLRYASLNPNPFWS